ncbi:Zinc-type alcohol dehydrogenase-like protein [Lachnellula occidentalis]|uniref:Zinc-type alcohol dehydrogenase-like protein n=1 Tax=Lachnellula occidentalis TaxID=215460 RepID=A0A8H8S2D9_9HELO|nr:Zinc-type alcohol dehydrogenase-like protein [Lachnellula occidentalis]
MTTIPKTMKAWIAIRAGPPQDILQLKPDWPTPAPPTAGEITIKISYAALNPGDAKTMLSRISCRSNSIRGMDFVGEVVQVGPLASTFTASSNVRLGMIVAGTVPTMHLLRGVGVLAQYMLLPADAVVEKPEGLEERVAAGLLGVVGQTNVVMLRASNVKKGDRVLVNGASGGVGCISVLVLSGMGMHVTGVCSGRNEALVRRLGAEEYLKPDGRYIAIEAGPFGIFKLNNWLPVILGGTPRTIKNIFSPPDRASAQEVVKWFENGLIKEIPIDSTFEMDGVLQVNSSK